MTHFRLLLAAMALLLSACGWQLRNAQVVPSNIGSLHIATQAADNIFVSELRRALDVYGVDVVSSAAEANYAVVIVDFRENRRIGTLNASARAAEYQLNEDVDFLITDPASEFASSSFGPPISGPRSIPLVDLCHS